MSKHQNQTKLLRTFSVEKLEGTLFSLSTILVIKVEVSTILHLKKAEKYQSFFEKKTVDQCSGANLKNMFFAKFCSKFLAFLGLMHKKR